ncbi:hypothetical protein Hdeb2414_s0871g00956131 [Helianthus debilis subsp. tardiflorus]
MAMAAKAKLLLRELKTVKADLAFAKERCAQLEAENKSLREKSGGDGDNAEDDDLVCLISLKLSHLFSYILSGSNVLKTGPGTEEGLTSPFTIPDRF